MNIYETSGRNARETAKLITSLEHRGNADDKKTRRRVQRIVDDVRRGGDKMLRRYAEKFDGRKASEPLLISKLTLSRALNEIPSAIRDALERAAENISLFARRQMPQEWDLDVAPGVTAGQRVRALDAVGCYVPSGRYPLPSTLLMTAVPAQIAGVKRIIAVSPKPSQETLAAASLLGIEEFYAIGGAHAVAAMAYGTETVMKVDKIVGPGNEYVTTAKAIVAKDCGIDMLAGPTEIGVTSEHGDAAFIASDIVAQCEHDDAAFAVLITTNRSLAKAVAKEARHQSRENATAKVAIGRNAYIFLAGSLEEARSITNRLAFEHLTVDGPDDLDWVTNAGSVFVGRWSAQAFGDYITGPNHTLPTGGLARVRGGLSVMDYIKVMTVQTYADMGVESLGQAAITLADCEGLKGHAEAVRLRLRHV